MIKINIKLFFATLLFFLNFLDAFDLNDCSSSELYWHGKNYRILGDYKRARQYLKKAFEKDPKNTDIMLELSFAYLACQNFKNGFDALHNYFSICYPLQNAWSGQKLKGKSILVICPKNGYGDVFMFMRYLQNMHDKGAKIILSIPEALGPLFSNLDYISDLILDFEQINYNLYYYPVPSLFNITEYLPKVDYMAHLFSLTKFLKINKKNIFSSPYINSDPNILNLWKNKLSNNNKFKIGICWKSALRSDPQLQARSIKLKELMPLFDLDATFYCLQKDLSYDELQLLLTKKNIVFFGDDFDKTNGAFVDTLALIKNLDLVITVDTSIANLAGATGAPVWVMLPKSADWRYLIEGSFTVWYPTMHLFRQTFPGDWYSVVEQVIDELKKEISK